MPSGAVSKQFLLDLKNEIVEDHVTLGAAALAYYLTLALFPMLLLTMTLVPYLPVQDVDQALLDLLVRALPPEASDMVVRVVEEVTRNRRGGLLSFGAIATLWAASAGMHAVIRQLNITYDVREGRNWLKVRAVALGLVLLFTVLVVGAFTLIVLGGALEAWIGETYDAGGALMLLFAALRWLLIVLALLLGFALIYYLGPDVEQEFRFITPGSVLGGLLLIAASLGFSFYVDNFANYSATYGSIGAVIVLMLWLFLAGLVILLGSEINALVEHYSAGGKRKGEKAA